MKRLAIILIGFLHYGNIFSQVTSDYAVMLTSTISEAPPSIALHWNSYTGATAFTVYRKAENSTAWGSAIASLPGDSLGFTDLNVVMDSAYEYRVVRQGNGIPAEGYLYGAIRLHATDNRGTFLLVVDTTVTDSIEELVYRLMNDVSGDGWAVQRLDISRYDSVPDVKQAILNVYNSVPDLKTVMLLGHVTVPYSGELNPDGHLDHVGAWPADVYYGDMDGDYTDYYVANASASRPENWNLPFDGKFDNTVMPSDVELEVGRVDLYDMPSFNDSEEKLLARYLDKDHNYRTGITSFTSHGLIDDNFGAFAGEAFASCGFRNFVPLMGDTAAQETDYFTTLQSESYLWSYGCGGGWYQGAGGVGSTADFALDSVSTVFTMLFGSYFGDWDNSDNFLRAPLASKGGALTSCWAGRPYWFFHHMALGENIGYSTKTSQNNAFTYKANYGAYWVHVALMGDPTLRMHVIKPPSDLVLTPMLTDSSVVKMNWTSSPDSVLGYYIYRSESHFGHYVRISEIPVTDTFYEDHPDQSATWHYMVRAVRLQETPSGSYYNLSEGIGDSLEVIVISGTENLISRRTVIVYPNPASDWLNVIVLESANKGVILNITDLSGHVIMQASSENRQEAAINISSLSPGMYMLSANGFVSKFIKQ